MAAEPALSVRIEDGQEVITLSLPGAERSKVFALSGPDRLVIDVPLQRSGFAVVLPSGYAGTLIRGVRSAQFDAHTTRIVFDLSAAPSRVHSRTSSGKHGTFIRIALGAGKGKESSPKQVRKSRERPVIVIDAGHGGQDPGAMGERGTREKDIVLEYGFALRKALQATGRYRVVMTRGDDRFILLRERVAKAREAKADLFISLHADSAPEGAAHGLSVYTLSEKASDAEAEALAARENKVDVIYGLDLSAQSKDVADILVSLAQRDTNNRSAALAGEVVDAMDGSGVRLLQNSHRFAGFAVLKAPDIPSVLVEIGFLSSPSEEKLLVERAYRARVVKALVKGIDAFFALHPRSERANL